MAVRAMTDTTQQPAPEAIGAARLQEIRERVEAASPGPWAPSWTGHVDSPENFGTVTRSGFRRQEDARFIAHARSDVPDLLTHIANRDQEIERLRAALAESEATVTRLRERTHELQARADKVAAPLQKDLAYLRGLMIEATHHYRNNQPELHRLRVEELIARCSEDFRGQIERFPLSLYDQATIAVLLGRLGQIEADLEAARAEAQALRERVRTDAIRHYPESGWEACRLCDGEWKRGQPEKHEEGCSAALAAPSAADGPQAICVQCFVVFPISHGEAEWIKEDGVRLLCPECCHDATGIDQWNDGDPSADGAAGGEG